MKQLLNIIVIISIVMLSACDSSFYPSVPVVPGGSNLSGSAINLTEYETVQIAGTQITVQPGGLENISTDVFPASEETPLVLDGFSIGVREVPWKLWNEVVEWGKKHTSPYTFANEGKSNLKALENGENIDANPVTWISARDAIVWCNAYSEMEGLKPVYVDIDGNVLRTSEKGTIERRRSAAGSGQSAVDNAKVNPDANGWRLPTVQEWIYVAKGANATAPEWKQKWMGLADEDITIKWESINDYGVFNFATKENETTVSIAHQVQPIAGTYHMLGNVAEYCYTTDSAYNKTLAVCGWDFDTAATDSPDKNPMGILFVDPGDNYPNGNIYAGLRLAKNN